MRKRIRIFLLAFFHAIWMVLMAFILVEADYMKGDEAFLVKYTSAVLRLLLPEPDKPNPKDYAFINVGWDKMLVDRLDADGFPSGNRSIVDRVKLNTLFAHMVKEPVHKFAVCDIVLLDPTPVDSAFQANISAMPRTAFSVTPNDTGEVTQGIFNLPHTGVVEYREVDNDFLKFRLVRGGLPSMPMTMFEMIDSGRFEKGNPFSWRNGRLAQNDFILDVRLRQSDLMNRDLGYAYADLHLLTDFIETGQGAQVSDFLRDRIVIIGDFEDRDIHKTLFGDTAGPLILTNIYIALHEGDNLIPPGFFLFLLLVFFITSIGLFTENDWLESLIIKIVGEQSMLWKLVLQGALYTVLFGLASIISFLLFKIHINFLLLAAYVEALEAGKHFLKTRREKRAKLNVSSGPATS
jgi:hypothetical protein